MTPDDVSLSSPLSNPYRLYAIALTVYPRKASGNGPHCIGTGKRKKGRKLVEVGGRKRKKERKKERKTESKKERIEIE